MREEKGIAVSIAVAVCCPVIVVICLRMVDVGGRQRFIGATQLGLTPELSEFNSLTPELSALRNLRAELRALNSEF